MYSSITELHAAYAAGETTVTEVVKASLLAFSNRADLNTAITVLTEVAEAKAKEQDHELSRWRRLPAESRQPLPPLFGVTLGIKDVLQLQGSLMTCASKILADYVSPFTATAVQRLLDAGAIPVAKLNCDEFAMGSSNENSAFGSVKNPVNPEYIPGGSSGGSAAAVAAGQCLIALGTDTGGSIRQPAAMCGVVGLKPTYGRVSRYGASALASSLDQIGPFANNVADVALVLSLIAGSDEHDFTAVQRPVDNYLSELKNFSWQGQVIGIPKEYFLAGMDEAVKARILAVRDWCADQGATIKDISLPHSEFALATYYLIQPAECSSNLARYDGMRFGHREVIKNFVPDKNTPNPYDASLKLNRQDFGPEVRRRLMLGAYTLSAGYYEAYYRLALKVRAVITRDFTEAFKTCDIILGPTSPTVAWKLGMKVSDPLIMYLSDIYTVSINLAGLPALSLPVGKITNQFGDDLPVGLQIIAPHWAEAKALNFAQAIEQGFNY